MDACLASLLAFVYGTCEDKLKEKVTVVGVAAVKKIPCCSAKVNF